MTTRSTSAWASIPNIRSLPSFSYFLCIDATKTGDVSAGGLGPKAEPAKTRPAVELRRPQDADARRQTDRQLQIHHQHLRHP